MFDIGVRECKGRVLEGGMGKRVSYIALSASHDKGVPLSAIFKHRLTRPLDGSSTSSMMIGLWCIGTTVLHCCLSWPTSLLSLPSSFSITLSERFSLDYALLSLQVVVSTGTAYSEDTLTIQHNKLRTGFVHLEMLFKVSDGLQVFLQ